MIIFNILWKILCSQCLEPQTSTDTVSSMENAFFCVKMICNHTNISRSFVKRPLFTVKCLNNIKRLHLFFFFILFANNKSASRPIKEWDRQPGWPNHSFMAAASCDKINTKQQLCHMLITEKVRDDNELSYLTCAGQLQTQLVTLLSASPFRFNLRSVSTCSLLITRTVF